MDTINSINNELEDLQKGKEISKDIKDSISLENSEKKLSLAILSNPIKNKLGNTKVGKAISAVRTISLISGGWIFILAGIIILLLIFFSYVANQSNQLDLFIICKGQIDNNCINEAFKKSLENQESRYNPNELE